MKRIIILISLILIVALASGFERTQDIEPAGKFQKIAAQEKIQPITFDRSIMKVAEALEDTAHPVFAEFLGDPVFEMGMTYYDMQHNSTLGRNIALDDEGGIHTAWMYANNPLISTRNIRYNYLAPGATEPQFDGGIRCDNAIYKSGYCTIDAKGHTPYIAYHEANSAVADYYSQISFDAASIESRGMIHGGFSPVDPHPPAVPMPDCADGRPDLINIWPVISISDIDNDIHIVSTTSDNDTVICSGEPVFVPNYMVYYHAENIIDSSGSVPTSEINFDDGVVLPVCRGVSPDIATAKTRDEVAIAYSYIGDYTCNWPDSTNIFLLRSSDDGASWDTTMITDYGPDYRVQEYDTNYYASIYGTIDSSSTPWDTIWYWGVDTITYYSRPEGDLNVFYDNDDNVHVTWMEGFHAADDSCTGDVVSTYYRTDIRHWCEANPDEITLPLSSYPSLIPAPLGDPSPADHVRLFYSSFSPNCSVGEDGTIYCIWQQYYGEVWWIRAIPSSDTSAVAYYDRSHDDWPNGEIFMSYSDDNGQTWSGPLNLSNTYTPFAESGDCQSELDPTIAKWTDDNIHVFFIEDADAGISIHEEGEFVNCRARYARVSTEKVKRAADLVDRISYLVTGEYPDTTMEQGLAEEDIRPNRDILNPYWDVKEYQPGEKPEAFDMARNFPNPFNARTVISYDITEPGNYILEVYNTNGTLVNVLTNSYLNKGNYSVLWEGDDLSGNTVPSGTYLYRLRDEEGNSLLRKMTLIK